MKRILVFIVAFFPLLAGATNSGQFEPSSTDLNSIEVNDFVDIKDGRVHRWYFKAYGGFCCLNIVKQEDGLYQIYTQLDLSDGKIVCNLFLDQMRKQPGWKWYERDGITEIDGYTKDPIRTRWTSGGDFCRFMNVYICNIQSVIEANPEFEIWWF